MTTTKCERCGAAITAGFAHQRFCSSRCRIAAFRAQKRDAPTPLVTPEPAEALKAHIRELEAELAHERNRDTTAKPAAESNHAPKTVKELAKELRMTEEAKFIRKLDSQIEKLEARVKEYKRRLRWAEKSVKLGVE